MLKLCDLVVQVGCGKCLVKGGLPGCLGGGRRQRGGGAGRGRGRGALTMPCDCWCMLRGRRGRIRRQDTPIWKMYRVYRVASYVMAFH